jgi:hypothetical protein
MGEGNVRRSEWLCSRKSLRNDIRCVCSIFVEVSAGVYFCQESAANE